MNRKIIITASILGMLAVVAGAFGAHGLKPKLSPADLDIWHTAVQYQFYHVFALLFLSTFGRTRSRLVSVAFYLFTLGILFFSGSLYLLSCSNLLGLTRSVWLGVLTPFGGLLFIAGWIALAMAAFRNR
ncbi:MAG: DUF423 domain-containing protein [Mucilaginibacter sp.]